MRVAAKEASELQAWTAKEMARSVDRVKEVRWLCSN